MLFPIAGTNITVETRNAIDISAEATASINLPPSLFLELDEDDQREVGVAFIFYSRPTFFPVRGFSGGRTVIGTPVIGALVTLVDQPFDNLRDPVTIQLQLNQSDQDVCQGLAQ